MITIDKNMLWLFYLYQQIGEFVDDSNVKNLLCKNKLIALRLN